MEYRGYLIARAPAEHPRSASAHAWAYGRVGYGIAGWARTRADAKRLVDRDIERQTSSRASDSELAQ